MALLTVGPNSKFPTIAAAMQSAGPGDTISLEPGYGGETAWVTHSGMIFHGGASSLGVLLRLGTGITSITLTGLAPINILDAAGGNGIVGNAGNNRITVTGGVDAVNGGLGVDRLVVDYRLATGAVSGNSTSNFTEAGGGGRTVTITDGTVEHFTVLTGTGADTITTGSGNDYINTGSGASTVSAGQGANTIIGGRNADTITALDGGNIVNAGNGANTVTTGGGHDIIRTGTGADTIVSGAGEDWIRVGGGADSVTAGAGDDRLVVDYSAATTAVVGGVTGGNVLTGYVGHIADQAVSHVNFQRSENFTILTGSGNDNIVTGGGADVILAFAGSDTLRGGAGNDLIHGGSGADLVIGGAGGDRLFGDAGTDALHGEGGKDYLAGGVGADVFVFRTAAAAGVGAGRDVIWDFQAGIDRIALSAIDANTVAAGNQAFAFIGAAAFTATAGELRYISGVVSGDTNGDGTADFSIAISGSVALNASDFLL